MKINSIPPNYLTQTAGAFAALGSEHRLLILRRLVRAGRDGVTIGELGDAVGVTGSVLTHHLKHLVNAGLIVQRRQGRHIYCSVVFEAVETLSQFLIAECCADAGQHMVSEDTYG